MRYLIISMGLLALVGCSDTAEPAAAEAPEATAGAEEATADTADTEAVTGEEGETADVEAVQPDATKLEKHIREHMQYPASRDQILAACAQTKEFTEGEKKWVADTLPEGEYDSPEAVISALGL